MSLTDIEKKGLKVFVGSEYNIRASIAQDSIEVIDFTQPGKVKLLFPTSFSVKKEREVIEQARIGVPTSVKLLGKTQIMGDIGDVATPNGAAWYAEMSLGGVVKSLENNQALISIEYSDRFLIEVTRDPQGQITEVRLVLDSTNTKTIAVPAGMKVKEFIVAVNALQDAQNNNLFLCVLHIGEGEELFNIEGTGTSYNCSIREFLRVGSLSVDYQKKVAKYISYIIPRRGNARYFNILVSSSRAPMSTQYAGCRFLSLNMQYQNNNLTNLTANIWAGYDAEFTGTPAQAEIDDLSSSYSQTNGQTKAYSCRQRATTIASMTNSFQWTVEPSWNIANEPYEIPVAKYSDSFDFEMMFNEQSRNIFEKYVNESRNISAMLDTKTFKNGIEYKIIKSVKTLLGQPQYPDIAEGVIGLQASGFTAVASVSDPYTSLMIITGDRLLDISYTQAEIDKDFPAYLP